MTTLAEARTRLRRLLEDSDLTAPLWSDIELNEWLQAATRDLAASVPREATVTLAAAAGQTDYALPSDARRVVSVTAPAGVPAPRRAPTQAHESGAAQSWAVAGGVLSFGVPPEGPITVAYRGLYPFPVSDGATFALPDEGLDAVVAGAAVLALMRLAVAGAKRRGGRDGVLQALAIARQLRDEAVRRCRRGRMV